MLFQDVVFGPIKSRRLGISLGINLLPIDKKYCTFNCIYCECGWTYEDVRMDDRLPTREMVRTRLEEKLIELRNSDKAPDSITFAGNGEPTIHPQFPEILDDTVELRNRYFPDAKVSVLSNSSTLDKPAVFQALKKAGDSMMKLDAGTERMFQLINGPRSGIRLKTVVEKLKEFQGRLIIQTLFLRGTVNGEKVDNTSEPEFSRWMEHVKAINPKYVVIYPIDRATPLETLEKIPFGELKVIAERVEKIGIKAQVFY
jgi:wyosine [tRNA(Phe)-imidazoG37] synthetase (radical SAM superfamily)